MRKYIFLSLFMLFCFFVFSIDVNAACAAGVSVGEESLCMVGDGAKSSDGTAYIENSMLVLNNYNGGSIQQHSGLGNPVHGLKVKLIGNNYITNESGYGMLVSFRGVDFVGSGTLTIKSQMPIVAADFDRESSSYSGDGDVSIVKISGLDETSFGKDENKKEEQSAIEENDKVETKKENTEEESDNKLLLVATLLSIFVSLACLVICITFILKNKKVENN